MNKSLRFLLLLVPLLLGRGGETESIDALVEAGHFRRAKAALAGLLAAEPNNAHWHYRLAQCQEAFGDLDAALKSARTAAQVDANNTTYRAYVAGVLSEKASHAGGLGALGTARSAKAEAEAAVRLDPNNMDALIILANYLAEAPGIAGGNKQEAAKLADRIAQLDPAEGYAIRVSLPPPKDAAAAEELYWKAIQANPKHYDARVGLARFQWLQKKYAAAEAESREAVKLFPDRIGEYEMLARIAADQQHLADLDVILAAAERAVPDNLSPYFFAGRRLLAAGGDPTRAESYLRKYLASEREGDAPTFAMAHWQLGLTLEKAGRKKEAVAELETACSAPDRLDSTEGVSWSH